MLSTINSGIYFLEIKNNKNFTIDIKTLGNIILKPGFYYYVGSAQKNLQNRLSRHISKSKKIHWHIDHLTSENDIRISKIYVIPNADKNEECISVNLISSKLNLQFPIKNFGNSDCRKCISHLLYSPRKIDQSHFSDLYQSMVSFIPFSKEIS